MSSILENVNWVDIFALILLIRIIYISSHVGVGKQILPLILLTAGLVLLLYYYPKIGDFIATRFTIPLALSEFGVYSLLTVVFILAY
ncbi:MAG: hypothetical protein JW994_02445, partial [Candidatus Omnitrophica bacterium]|nr:hypothetical protein [Candidatus Omnitrophota bacterium]